MYAEYAWVDSAARADVISDIVAILTGETVVANLSAACDKPNTTITATVAAGWSVWDSNAGSDGQVIRSAFNDDASNYKYAYIYGGGSVGSTVYVYCQVAEDWDEVGHTGTNVTDNTNYLLLNVSPGAATEKRVYISANARGFTMTKRYVQSGIVYVGDSTRGGCIGCWEHTRILPWHTIASAYPKHIALRTGAWVDSGQSYRGMQAPRLKNSTGGDSTQVWLDYLYIPGNNRFNIWGGTTGIGAGSLGKLPDGSGNYVILMYPFWIATTRMNLGAPLGELSTLNDVWQITEGPVPFFTTFAQGANTYIVFPSYFQSSTPNDPIAVRAE